MSIVLYSVYFIQWWGGARLPTSKSKRPILDEEQPLCMRSGNSRLHPLTAALHVHRKICELLPEITIRLPRTGGHNAHARLVGRAWAGDGPSTTADGAVLPLIGAR